MNAMKTPFTTEQFFGAFEAYNRAVFPGQIVVALLGLVAILLLFSKSQAKSKLIGGFLGLLWLWIGIVYQIAFFAPINPVARVFGGLFVLQGLLIIYNEFKGRLSFSLEDGFKVIMAYFIILFGLVLYPIIGVALGKPLIQTISLGLPCPSVIFTFGLFMLSTTKFPRYLLIVPSLWAVVGLSAAINFGVYQDFYADYFCNYSNPVFTTQKNYSIR